MQIKQRIGKWRTLSPLKRRLWLKAAFSLCVIGVSLKLMRFSTFKKRFSDWNRRFPAQAPTESQVADVVWAVESAARILPLNLKCLPQSLAVKYLLGRSEGIVMHIGVNKESQGNFQFHAWVEKKGKTIIGELPTCYQPLWVWE